MYEQCEINLSENSTFFKLNEINLRLPRHSKIGGKNITLLYCYCTVTVKHWLLLVFLTVLYPPKQAKPSTWVDALIPQLAQQFAHPGGHAGDWGGREAALQVVNGPQVAWPQGVGGRGLTGYSISSAVFLSSSFGQ